MKVTGPASVTLTFIAATTAEYDALLAWLNAADLATRQAVGILSFTGTRDQRECVFTMESVLVDVETDVPLTVPGS